MEIRVASSLTCQGEGPRSLGGTVITQKSGTGAAFQTMLSRGCPRVLEPCAGLQAPSICMWASLRCITSWSI